MPTLVKAMGYGLSDLIPGTDPRVNWEVMDAILHQPQKFTDDMLAEYVLARHEETDDMLLKVLYTLIKDELDPQTYEAAQHVLYPDNGAMRLLMFVPYLSHKTWVRYDDPIDYAESKISKGSNHHINLLDTPPAPYDMWMNSRTGETLSNAQVMSVRLYQNFRSVGVQMSVGLEEIIRQGGFTSDADIRHNFNAVIPETVRYFADMTGVFTDPETVTTLKPLVATYFA